MPANCSCARIYLAKKKAKVRFQAFSSFPPSTRDLALVVDETASAESVRRDVEAAAKTAVGSAFALESVAIFDLYTGTGLPAGKKSLAFALRFRSLERTLKDDEVNAVFTAIQQTLTAGGKYTVRS